MTRRTSTWLQLASALAHRSYARIGVPQVYSEVYRVLKPGSIFMTYEWVTTPAYDPSNAQHVACVDEIIIGNGLPVRSEGAKQAGSLLWRVRA